MNEPSRPELLAIAYAGNRMAFSAINKQIKAFLIRKGDSVDLSEIRNEYLEEANRWRGWEHAISSLNDDEEVTDEQRELAALLDAKAALRIEAGTIKRNIYAAGKKLLNQQAKASA